jgi:hypothetical protein
LVDDLFDPFIHICFHLSPLFNSLRKPPRGPATTFGQERLAQAFIFKSIYLHLLVKKQGDSTIARGLMNIDIKLNPYSDGYEKYGQLNPVSLAPPKVFFLSSCGGKELSLFSEFSFSLKISHTDSIKPL